MRRKKKKVKWIAFILLIISLISICKLVPNKDKEINYLSSLDSQKYYYKNLKYSYSDLEEELNIQRINYSWKKTLKGYNNPKIIVFHHTDADILSPEDINEIHKENGWDGIGYHYYIRKDGTIYAGRPEECIGSHVYGDNKESLGICLEGNFEKEEPSEKEIESLVDLSVYLIIKYNIGRCVNHSNLYNTLCPGKLFPKDTVDEMITKKLLNYYAADS